MKTEEEKYENEFYKHADAILGIPFIKRVEITIETFDGKKQTLVNRKIKKSGVKFAKELNSEQEKRK